MMRFLLLLIVLCGLCVMPLMAQDARTEDAYQEVLRRIEAARVSGATELSLDYLDFEHLPPEIGQLTSLQTLSIADAEVFTLPPEIGQLKNLHVLVLFNIPLVSLPPEISQLKNLQRLTIGVTPLKELPAEVGQLKNLQVLVISNNQLAKLPPEIGQLPQLQALFFADNPLTTLPVELGHLSRLTDFSTPPFTFPPPQITSQGTAATLAYLRDYEAMQMRLTIAGLVAGFGAIAGAVLAFSWRQRYALGEKKKRL